jgi:hypothetical protein
MSFGPALAAFIRSVVGPLFTYATHPGAVVAQAADGTVEVKPDSPTVAPQKGVPLTLGVPGIKVKVGPGTRVRLSFASGKPDASEVALWEGDGLLELELDASVKVVLKAPAVHLGEANPAYSVALAEKVNQRLGNLEAAFDAHFHGGPGSPVVAIPGVIPVETAFPAGPGVVGSVASSTVKAKG